MLNYIEENQIVTLSLNDGKANAVSHAFVEDMNKALTKRRALQKRSSLKACLAIFAGFDLEEFKKGPEATSALVNKGGRMLPHLHLAPASDAAVTGHAIAAARLCYSRQMSEWAWMANTDQCQ